MPSKTTPPLTKAWFIWGLGALLYLMGFFHRVAPAVMTHELMRDFDINAAGLGNLSAFYFYSYVAMQIPTGIIADTWGPRRLLASGAVLAGIGAVLFATAHGLAWAGFGRLLIGGSVAVAYVGLLKISSSWFPPRYYGMVAGFALLFGIIGAVGAGAPLRLFISIYGWRSVILVSSLITFVIGLAIWLFMRDFPHELGYADHMDPAGQALLSTRRSVASGIIDVCRYPNTFFLVYHSRKSRGLYPELFRPLGRPFSHDPLRPENLNRRRTDFRSSGFLGCGRTFFRLVFRSHRGPKAALYHRCFGIACGVADSYFHGESATVRTCRIAPGDRIQYRLHDHQLCLCQGIGSPGAGRDDFRYHQYGPHVGTDDPAAGHRLDS